MAFLCFLAVFLAGASFFISLAAGEAAGAGAGAAAAAGAEAWAKAPIETVAAIRAARILFMVVLLSSCRELKRSKDKRASARRSQRGLRGLG